MSIGHTATMKATNTQSTPLLHPMSSRLRSPQIADER
jgi:hypothetical protein